MLKNKQRVFAVQPKRQVPYRHGTIPFEPGRELTTQLRQVAFREKLTLHDVLERAAWRHVAVVNRQARIRATRGDASHDTLAASQSPFHVPSYPKRLFRYCYNHAGQREVAEFVSNKWVICVCPTTLNAISSAMNNNEAYLGRQTREIP